MVTQLNIVSDENNSQMLLRGFADGDTQPIDSGNNTKTGLALNISSVLQTTLEIEQLVTLFSQQIKPALPHDGFSYHNDPLGLAIHVGKKSKFQSQYRLLVNGEPLGELSLHRDWQFGIPDNKVFEYTLCALVYPLRNAIMYRQALYAAHKDALTGVNNRSTLEESLNREVKLAHRYSRSLSMIILDIDNFKSINDNYGHSFGDEVIVETAKRVQSCIRSTDIVFRYGGEEFVILLSNTDLEGAAYLADRIRQSVSEEEMRKDKLGITVTISLGAAELKSGEINANFFARADAALYEAKNAGKNCVKKADY